MNLPTLMPSDWSMDVPDADVRVARVLVPVDFSACTLEVLQQAKRYAKQFAAAVDVLHVIPRNTVRGKTSANDARLICLPVEFIRRGLQRLVETLWANEFAGTVVVREGLPDKVIIQEAHRRHADLIVIGSERCKGLLKLFRRNTLAKVIRNAPCPVLAVRIRKD